MTAFDTLRNAGQSLWLNGVGRELDEGGRLPLYIADYSVSGLICDPPINDRWLALSGSCAVEIGERLQRGHDLEQLFRKLVLDDAVGMADLLLPVYVGSGGLDGFASIDVSPMLADDATAMISEASALFAKAQRRNLLIRVPGTRAGLAAIEELVAVGVPVHATLLFSRDHYRSAAEAYLRAIERRIAAGLDPEVPSVAALFVSRCDAHTATRLPTELRNRLGLAVAESTYAAHQEILGSERWQQLLREGARPQRLLWASPSRPPNGSLPDADSVTAIFAAGTIHAICEQALLAFAALGTGPRILLTGDCSEANRILAGIRTTGLNLDGLAPELLVEENALRVQSWNQALCSFERSVRCELSQRQRGHDRAVWI